MIGKHQVVLAAAGRARRGTRDRDPSFPEGLQHPSASMWPTKPGLVPAPREKGVWDGHLSLPSKKTFHHHQLPHPCPVCSERLPPSSRKCSPRPDRMRGLQSSHATWVPVPSLHPASIPTLDPLSRLPLLSPPHLGMRRHGTARQRPPKYPQLRPQHRTRERSGRERRALVRQRRACRDGRPPAPG